MLQKSRRRLVDDSLKSSLNRVKTFIKKFRMVGIWDSPISVLLNSTKIPSFSCLISHSRTFRDTKDLPKVGPPSNFSLLPPRSNSMVWFFQFLCVVPNVSSHFIPKMSLELPKQSGRNSSIMSISCNYNNTPLHTTWATSLSPVPMRTPTTRC